jgi:hypothetical protein
LEQLRINFPDTFGRLEQFLLSLESLVFSLNALFAPKHHHSHGSGDLQLVQTNVEPIIDQVLVAENLSNRPKSVSEENLEEFSQSSHQDQNIEVAFVDLLDDYTTVTIQLQGKLQKRLELLNRGKTAEIFFVANELVDVIASL